MYASPPSLGPLPYPTRRAARAQYDVYSGEINGEVHGPIRTYGSNRGLRRAGSAILALHRVAAAATIQRAVAARRASRETGGETGGETGRDEQQQARGAGRGECE